MIRLIMRKEFFYASISNINYILVEISYLGKLLTFTACLILAYDLTPGLNTSRENSSTGIRGAGVLVIRICLDSDCSIGQFLELMAMGQRNSVSNILCQATVNMRFLSQDILHLWWATEGPRTEVLRVEI